MIEANRLRAIVESDSDDPRLLAQIAGGNPRSFYRGANFDDADLRGVDLTGFNLHAASFRRARVDRNTKVDRQFRKSAGLIRVTVSLLSAELITHNLMASGIIIESPAPAHLGDLIEEAMNDVSRLSMLLPISDGVKAIKDYGSLKNITEIPEYTQYNIFNTNNDDQHGHRNIDGSSWKKSRRKALPNLFNDDLHSDFTSNKLPLNHHVIHESLFRHVNRAPKIPNTAKITSNVYLKMGELSKSTDYSVQLLCGALLLAVSASRPSRPGILLSG